MPQSNYSRFSDGVQISGVSMNVHQKGRVVYVCNSTTVSPLGITGSDGNDGRTPDRPFATITQALSVCVANRGDKIILLPGHAETVSAAAGIAFNVQGVSVVADPLAIGSQRPTITLGTANTATVTVTAPEVTLSGILFVANFLNIATCINVSGTAATDVQISNCEFRDTSAILCFTAAITTSATANGNDGLTAIGNRFQAVGTAAATSFLKVGANLSRLLVANNSVDIQGTTATTGALVLATAHVLKGARVVANDVASNLTTSAAGCLIVAGAGGSGFVADNYINVPAASTAILDTTGSGLGHFNNLVARSAADVSGLLLPVVSS